MTSNLGIIASSGSVASFDPETGTDNVEAGYWAEASVWTPPSEGAEVTSWTNWSDLSYALPLLKTGTNAPTYTASDSNLNSQPALQFTRTNSEFLEVDFTVWDSVVGGAEAAPHTIITIFQVNNLTATQYIVDGDGISNRRTQHVFATSGTLRAFGGVSCDITNGVSANVPFLAIAEYDSTPSLRLIGNGADSSASNTGTTGSMRGLHAGSLYTGGGSYLDGSIALIIVTNTTVASLSWISDLISWAKTHYGITDGT